MEHRRQTVWTRPLKDNERRSIADKIGRRQAKLAHLQLKRRAVGEIVSSDEDGHSRFEWLVNRGPQRRTLIYYVFDLLMLDGKDPRHLPVSSLPMRCLRFMRGHPRLLEVEHIERDGLYVRWPSTTACRLNGRCSEAPFLLRPNPFIESFSRHKIQLRFRNAFAVGRPLCQCLGLGIERGSLVRLF